MLGLHCVDCGECLVYTVWIVVNVWFTLCGLLGLHCVDCGECLVYTVWIVVNVWFTLCGLW